MNVIVMYVDPQTVEVVGVLLGKVVIDVILNFVQAMWIYISVPMLTIIHIYNYSAVVLLKYCIVANFGGGNFDKINSY